MQHILIVDGDPIDTKQLKFLLRNKHLGVYRSQRLYRRADVDAAIEQIRTQRFYMPAIGEWPCPGCGCALPHKWLLDRCHRCLRRAA